MLVAILLACVSINPTYHVEFTQLTESQADALPELADGIKYCNQTLPGSYIDAEIVSHYHTDDQNDLDPNDCSRGIDESNQESCSE